MSLKYGLNVTKAAPPPVRKRLLDDDEDDDDDDNYGATNATPDKATVEELTSFGGGSSATKLHPSSKPHARKTAQAQPPPPRRAPKPEDEQDLSTLHASRAQIAAAESLDPSIFDYDTFHAAKTSVTDAAKATARQDARDRKPKYINNLLDAAAKRKQDQQIAKEKMLQREREAEGDEFADKEKFVTGAYKAQQQENRRVEEEERGMAEAEERRKRAMGGGGMQGFYRGYMAQREREHREAVDAAAKAEQGGPSDRTGEEEDGEKSDAQLAAELRAQGVNVHLNDEGQVTDKRELLSAGLNVAPSGKNKNDRSGADHLRTSARPTQPAFQGRNDAGRQAQRERQSRMLEDQLAAQAKRAREEEEEERLRVEKAARSSKSDKDVSDAKARYLARKAAKERGEA